MRGLYYVYLKIFRIFVVLKVEYDVEDCVVGVETREFGVGRKQNGCRTTQAHPRDVVAGLAGEFTP